MNTSELRKQVREAVKNFGLTNKDVSVSVKCSGYSDRVDVRAKHPDIDFKGLQIALSKFKDIDYCRASGEILSGGNTYVFIHHPDGYLRDWTRDF